MIDYLLNVYRGERLYAAKRFPAVNGRTAWEIARQILAYESADSGELFFDDGTGQYMPYTRIKAEPTS